MKQALEGSAAQEARIQKRRELKALVQRVLDAQDPGVAEEALTQLKAHPQGEGLWQVLSARFIDLVLAEYSHPSSSSGI